MTKTKNEIERLYTEAIVCGYKVLKAPEERLNPGAGSYLREEVTSNNAFALEAHHTRFRVVVLEDAAFRIDAHNAVR
ncbi:MAG: hypothetical protein AAF938_24875 [Myxococcota bacterium]